MSRYQFECHSGECLAIYNACDGIPQCQDGSDEAAELACPGGKSVLRLFLDWTGLPAVLRLDIRVSSEEGLRMKSYYF